MGKVRGGRSNKIQRRAKMGGTKRISGENVGREEGECWEEGRSE